MWKLWTLTSLTRPKCVANWMKLHSSFLGRCKTCTCKVVPITYTALVSEIFSTTAHGGTSGDTLRKNWATECNPGRNQLTLFTQHFGLTFTRGGLKGARGALGRSFSAQCLRYSCVVGQRSADTTLTSRGA